MIVAMVVTAASHHVQRRRAYEPRARNAEDDAEDAEEDAAREAYPAVQA